MDDPKKPTDDQSMVAEVAADDEDNSLENTDVAVSVYDRDNQLVVVSNNDYIMFVTAPTDYTPQRVETDKNGDPYSSPMYACDICDKHFPRPSKVLTHRRTHTGEKPFKCPDCELSFAQKKSMLEHHARHTGDLQHKCDHCPAAFRQRGGLSVHMRKKHPDAEKTNLCKICRQVFSTKAEADQHRKTQHSTDLKKLKPFGCDLCGESFTRQSQVQTHQMIHTGEKPFICGVCDKEFRTKRGVMAHMIAQHQHDSSQCQHRSNSASTINESKSSQTSSQFFAKPNMKKTVVCTRCNSDILKSQIASHVRSKHGFKDVHQCSICSKCFDKKDSLDNHIRVHTNQRPFPCKLCPKSFKQRGHLHEHVRGVHYKESKNYLQCEQCMLHFLKASKFKAHKCLGGNNDSVFMCAACEKKFDVIADVWQHECMADSQKPEELVSSVETDGIAVNNLKATEQSNDMADQDETFSDVDMIEERIPVDRVLPESTVDPSYDEPATLEETIVDSTDAYANSEKIPPTLKDNCTLSESGQIIVSDQNSINTHRDISKFLEGMKIILNTENAESSASEFTIDNKTVLIVENASNSDSSKDIPEKMDYVSAADISIGKDIVAQGPAKLVNEEASNAEIDNAIKEITVQNEEEVNEAEASEEDFYTEEIQETSESKIELTNTDVDLYLCSACGLSFLGLDEAHEHVNSHNQSPPGLSCHLCGAAYTNKSSLRSHMSRSHPAKALFCVLCHKKFKNKASFRVHQRTQHLPIDEYYQCHVCQKEFSNKQKLTHHMRYHSDDLPFKCKDCSIICRSEATLTKHMKTHTRPRPHGCIHCDKCFHKASTLRAHIRSHTGEKPFSCKYCEKSFRQRSHLIEHERSHTGEKAYRCEECDVEYSYRSGYASHMSKFHSDNPKVSKRKDTEESTQDHAEYDSAIVFVVKPEDI